MAVVNLLTTALSNIETATPPVLNQPVFTGANDFTAVGIITTGASDSNNSTYRYVALPSNAIVFDIQVMNAANTSGTSYECGLFAYNGGAVLTNCAAVLIPAGTTMASARSVWTSLFFPAITNGTASAANIGLRLWELAGLTTDPAVYYEIVVTAVTAGSAGGVMALKINWTR